MRVPDYINVYLFSAVVAWVIAQLFKTAVVLIKTKEFDVSKLMASGGMPSSHTSSVTALSTAVGISEGFDTALFAACAVFSLVIMYDAAGVRRAAGVQAAVINKIVDNIEAHGLIMDKKLKEILGHTPFEVMAGAALGIATGLFFTLGG